MRIIFEVAGDGAQFQVNHFIAGLGASSSPGPWCGVVVDGAHIYWGNHNGTIGRANLDGTDANESFITGPSMSSLLLLPCAVDNDYLYWALISANRPADPPSPWIGRARLDGTDVQAHFINVQPDSGGCAIGR